jgi:hypothetical protein
MSLFEFLDDCAIGQSIIPDVRRGDHTRTLEVKIIDISKILPCTSKKCDVNTAARLLYLGPNSQTQSKI